MTEEIGLISFGDGGEIFVGRDYQKQSPYSDELASVIDKEVKKIIDNAHQNALDILKMEKETEKNSLSNLANLFQPLIVLMKER